MIHASRLEEGVTSVPRTVQAKPSNVWTRPLLGLLPAFSWTVVLEEHRRKQRNPSPDT
jgi:hypothetical protein